MASRTASGQKKNLFLCLDAFNTLYTPQPAVGTTYHAAAVRHGLCIPSNCPTVEECFHGAFTQVSRAHPNFGHASGLSASDWWARVIQATFRLYMRPGSKAPRALVEELLRTYAGREGYAMYEDVKPLLELVREARRRRPGAEKGKWKWDRTVVGVVSNSDARVPGVLQDFGLKVGARRFGNSTAPSSPDGDNDIDFVVLSYDVGVEKPDRRIFNAAVDMLGETLAGNEEGLAVEDFTKVYVGDDFEKDYQGARRAGWDSVLLTRLDAERELRDRDSRTEEVVGATSLMALVDMYDDEARRNRPLA